ncbi:MAG: hypothetical protein EOP84_22030 [Verrucomicrobiaceae bacterium]|nr:MAG: hypothetical protein EOP84_22030 [Verrucomicrobiaceae bacterium]
MSMLSLVVDQPHLAARLNEVTSLIELLTDDAETALVLDLLKRANCYSGEENMRAATNVAECIAANWSLMPANTWLVARDIEEKASSADAALQLVRMCLTRVNATWASSNFLSTMDTLTALPENSNVVLIDDFIGTGRKVSEKVEWIRRNTHVRSIFIATFHSQQQAADTLTPIVDGYFSSITTRKGISDAFDETMAAELRDLMKRIEIRFGKISAKMSLGYRGSESLYFQLMWNTPNNVFPIFWTSQHQFDGSFRPILIRNR